MKVIMFSRYFPAYHPKKGEPTFFVEQILNAVMPKQENGIIDLNELPEDIVWFVNDFVLLNGEQKKFHTIRAGNRWKVGDHFSPRVWSDKPYASKQIEFAPPIEIKKIFSFEITDWEYSVNGQLLNSESLSILAGNDGLDINDFELWFSNYRTNGSKLIFQIICWNENINYLSNQ